MSCRAGTPEDATGGARGDLPPKEAPSPSPSPKCTACEPAGVTPAPPASSRPLDGSGLLDFLEVYTQAKDLAHTLDPEAELFHATMNDAGGGRIDPDGRSTPATLSFRSHHAEREVRVELKKHELTARWVPHRENATTVTPTCGSAAAWNTAHGAIARGRKTPVGPAFVMELHQDLWFMVFAGSPPQWVNNRTCALVDSMGRPKGSTRPSRADPTSGPGVVDPWKKRADAIPP